MRERKRLIINADDFALDDNMTDGVIECFQVGTITQTSMITTSRGKYIDHAVDRWLENADLPIGCHVTLCSNNSKFNDYLSPITKNVDFLCDGQGHFRRLRTNFSYLLCGRWDRFTADIKCEIRQQVLRLKEFGMAVSHINGHCYIEAVPLINKVMLQICEEEKIQYFRFAYEEDYPGGFWKSRGYCSILRFLLASRGMSIAHSIAGNSDQYIGVNSLGFNTLRQYISYMKVVENKAGVCEMAVHVPQVRESSKWYHNHMEYDIIRSSEFKTFVNNTFNLVCAK